MEVPGVGAGAGITGMEFSGGLRAVPGPKGPGLAALAGLTQPGDTISAILGELSAPEVVRFLEIIERLASPENAAQVEGLLRESVSAVAQGNVPHALVKLVELAALDPRRAETLEMEPGLASIRTDVGQLLSHLTSVAHLDAESRLGQATHLLQAAGSHDLLGQEIRPEIAILIAGRFLEAGGYANYMRAAEVSQMQINLYVSAPTPAPRPLADPRGIPVGSAHPSPSFRNLRNYWVPRIRELWLRAPLLVLLLAWFAAGFLGGSVLALLHSFWPQRWSESLVAGAFEIWAVGFLALIAFGFYSRVRNLRR